MSHGFSATISTEAPQAFWRWRLVVALSAVILVPGLTGCRKVPDVVGMDQNAATEELKKAKLEAKVTTRQSGKTPGSVIDQDPKGGAKLPKDKIVTIVVEPGGPAGPAGGNNAGSTTTAGVITVPQVEGRSLVDAIPQLANAGLRTTIRRVESPKPPDTVVELNPKGGTQVAPNTEVIVSVPDSLVAVPDVTTNHLQQIEAVVQLTQKGLKVGSIESKFDAPGATGTVIEQFPKQGERVAIGSEVRLIVKGAPVTVPTVSGNGIQVNVAINNIASAGLKSAAQYDETSNRPPGTVLLQRPNPGAQVAPGSEVILTVAGKAPLFGIDPRLLRILIPIKPSNQ